MKKITLLFSFLLFAVFTYSQHGGVEVVRDTLVLSDTVRTSDAVYLIQNSVLVEPYNTNIDYMIKQNNNQRQKRKQDALIVAGVSFSVFSTASIIYLARIHHPRKLTEFAYKKEFEYVMIGAGVVTIVSFCFTF